LPDMSAGTIGLRVSGRITRDDFGEIEPTIRRAAEQGDVRIVEVIGPDYEGIGAGAVVEDLKFGLEFFVRHRSALKRIAVVTETDWIVRAVQAFMWLIPGEARVFRLSELEQAKAWAARADSPDTVPR
jgi:SpoIIAA-like